MNLESLRLHQLHPSGRALKESVSYDSMTIAQLKELLDSKRIEYTQSTKKADLIKLLEGDK